jgi:hypothetical protein
VQGLLRGASNAEVLPVVRLYLAFKRRSRVMADLDLSRDEVGQLPDSIVHQFDEIASTISDFRDWQSEQARKQQDATPCP